MAEGGPEARRRDVLREAERHLHHNRGLAIALLAAALAFTAALAGYELLKRPADVHNAHVHFQLEKPPPPKAKAKAVNWPIFGLNPARTRYLPAPRVKPPYRLLWHYSERPLLEFPPVYARGRLYAINNDGTAFALDANTGKTLWERRIGRLNASSPAYHRGRLYVVNLVPGHVLKLDAKTGKTLWKRSLPGRAESSPLVLGNTLYFGCEDGSLYALSTRNGNVRWATALGGPVKSAPAFSKGTLYVGDYGGYMNAVDARTGKLKWQSGSLGPGFGASGQFYSTPGPWPGLTRPVAMSTPDRPSPVPGARRRASTSAPSTATSTRSMPKTAKPAGHGPWGVRWSARSRRSATSSTSPSSPTPRRLATTCAAAVASSATRPVPTRRSSPTAGVSI